jgi:uncharacterized membrane protein
VVFVRGLWNRVYRLDEAAERLPQGTKISNAYSGYSQNSDTRLTGFNLDWASIYKQDVMVLANVETRGITLGQVKIIQKWVQDGGSLIVLGGLMTLGQNGNMERGWPELLPVELNGPFEVRRAAAPIEFAIPAKALGVDIQKWQSPPQVFFRHIVKAKPDATVLIAGNKGEPLLVGGQYGKGRVVVFTGTVLGEAIAGKTAFWQSPAWPGILAAAIKWSRGS